MKTIKHYLKSTALFALTLGFYGAAQAGIITIDGPPAHDVDSNPGGNPTVVQLNVANTGTIQDLNLAMHIVDVECDSEPTITLVDNGCVFQDNEVYWGDYLITLTHNGMTQTVLDQFLDDNGIFVPGDFGTGETLEQGRS